MKLYLKLVGFKGEDTKKKKKKHVEEEDDLDPLRIFYQPAV